MKSLADWAGIPITWNEAGDGLIFDNRLKVKETKSRLRRQLRPVLPDEDSCAPADAVQYWMYNGISLPEDADAFARLGIQYELTLLYPTPLGFERSKTLGHIHTFPSTGRLNYAEVCEVLSGEAYFLLQTLDTTTASASYVYAVHARQGDKILLPPNSYHLTINAGADMLLFSDLISVDTRGSYEALSAMGGAAYRLGSEWVKNDNYREVSPLREVDAIAFPSAGMTPEVPLYELIQHPSVDLRWLNNPALFQHTFPSLAGDIEHFLGE